MKLAPPFKLRAVMLDLARTIEKQSYYAGLLPWLAAWGYNAVHLHLTDDEGCALRFPSHPELATAHAYSAAEMRDFVALARRHGLAVIPEVESLGHSQYVTRRRRYRHLAEPLPDARRSFNAICPAHPETRALLSDLLRDVAAIFDHPLIHVGLDEVQLGECPRCRQKFGARRSSWEIFGVHAAWVHDEVRKLGRRPAMWTDHVVKQPEMLKLFERDVLMFQWDYNADVRTSRTTLLLDAGHEVVVCPATHCSTSRVLPNAASNLKNLRNTAARNVEHVRRGVVGLDNTVWYPRRYLPGAIDFGMALAAHLASVAEEDPRFAERFVARFYGTRAVRGLAAALCALHELSPDKDLYERIVYGSDRRGERFNREDRRECALLAERLATVLAELRRGTARVTRHRDRYDDLLISAEALLCMARFGVGDRRVSVAKEARALLRRAPAARSSGLESRPLRERQPPLRRPPFYPRCAAGRPAQTGDKIDPIRNSAVCTGRHACLPAHRRHWILLKKTSEVGRQPYFGESSSSSASPFVLENRREIEDEDEGRGRLRLAVGRLPIFTRHVLASSHRD